MQLRSRAVALILTLAIVAGLVSRARADDRLAGYWVPASADDIAAGFSFSILGKWTIMSAHWDGYAPDLKIRYTVVTTGDTGTLTADQKLDQLPDAPRTIEYEARGGELILTIRDTAHVGKYHLVKGVAPASAPVAGPPPARAGPPARPRGSPTAAHDPNAVLGDWTTEPGASLQIGLYIVISGPTSVKITQMWTRGIDNPAVSHAKDYAVVFSAGGLRGTFTRDQPDYEGSPIPLRLDYEIAGDALIVTVGDGAFAGQYRLVRKPK
jgi:hypothetical protein